MKWVQSGAVILVESIALLVSHSESSLHLNNGLHVILCAALAGIILVGSCVRAGRMLNEKHRPAHNFRSLLST